MAFLSMAGATLLRGVSTTARDAVAVGCCRWEQWHDVDDAQDGMIHRLRQWHECFPNARSLETCNEESFFAWPCDALTPLMQLPRLTSLSVWCLSVPAALALASAIGLGTLPRLENIGVGEIAGDVAAFGLGRSLTGCPLLRSVTISGGFADTDASNIGAFLEGLSDTQTVTQLSFMEMSISHIVNFNPRLPHLRTLSLSCCWGDTHVDEFGGGAVLEDQEAFLLGLRLLAPCTSLSHLSFDPDSVGVPLTLAILALPHLPSLSHVCAIDGDFSSLPRPKNQIVADKDSLLHCAPRLEQLVVQRHRTFVPGPAASRWPAFEPTICDVAIRRAVPSASGTPPLAQQWAYAILPLAAAHPSRKFGDDLRHMKWDEDHLQVFERLACMACMQGPPPHEALKDGGGQGGSPGK